MSFLNRSKTSIQDSPFGSRIDTKDSRTFTQPSNTKPREDVAGNLKAFRDDIRKQISDKISKNYKFLDVSSPKVVPDIKTLFSTKNAETSTPLKASLFNDSSVSTKASQKRFDLKQEFSKRGERGSPAREASSNSKGTGSELLSQLARIREGTGPRISASSSNLKNSMVNRSPVKNRSPAKKDTQSALDLRPLDYFKKDVEHKSYLDLGRPSASNKQQDFREDIKLILENGRTPKRRDNLNSSNLINNDNRQPSSGSGLAQKISQLRSSHIIVSNNPSILAGSYENSINIKNTSIDHGKTIDLGRSDHYRNTAGVVNSLIRTEEPSKKKGLELKSLNIFSPKTNTTQDSFSWGKQDSGARERDRLASDQFPLSRVYELQDLFYNVSDKGFDQLSSEYVEELIKLSSVIMHRVKNSSYYNRT